MCREFISLQLRITLVFWSINLTLARGSRGCEIQADFVARHLFPEKHEGFSNVGAQQSAVIGREIGKTKRAVATKVILINTRLPLHTRYLSGERHARYHFAHHISIHQLNGVERAHANNTTRIYIRINLCPLFSSVQFSLYQSSWLLIYEIRSRQ